VGPARAGHPGIGGWRRVPAYGRPVVTAEHARTRDDIVRLAHRGLPVAEFARAVGGALLRAVPAEGTCLLTLDPATLLPTAEYVENGLPAAGMLRLVDIELREPDFTKWAQLARAARPAASLSAATGGDLDRSLRQREVRRPAGFGDELRAVLAGGTGAWGALTVFRGAGQPHFAPAEVRFLSSTAGLIADGLRRGLLLDAARRGVDDVGLLVLDPDDGVRLANAAAERWLDELGAGDRAGARMPLVVPAVARRARAADGPDPVLARARARTRRGRWVVVRGSLMGEGPGAPVGLVLEAARPAELAPLIADAYGLTGAERRVTELVARGLSTREISARLRVSTHTVHDHLKSIFAKSGARSRGELVAALFADHYAGSLTS
jgi:DNA-binding CsgD family transcriptional regulator